MFETKSEEWVRTFAKPGGFWGILGAVLVLAYFVSFYPSSKFDGVAVVMFGFLFGVVRRLAKANCRLLERIEELEKFRNVDTGNK